MTTFGERLRFLRLELNFTQEEIGKRFGKSKNNISQYERNIRQADDEFKKQIADFFDVSLDYLLGRSNERNPKEDSGIVTKAFHLAEDVDELPQEALDQIDEYIRLLKMKYKDKK